MKFEVKRDGVTLMSTTHKSCVPNKATREQMKAAGYKLTLNGKSFDAVCKEKGWKIP